VAAWIRYTAGNDLAGARHPVDDPMADTFATLHADHRGSEALIAAFLGLDSVFPRDLTDDARFSAAVLEAYRTLDEGGVERSLTGLDVRTR
jgi:fructuronate reductase